MTHHTLPAPQVDRDLIPRRLVRVMFVLVVSILGLVTAFTLAGGQQISTPPATPILAERQIVLWGDNTGAATVHDGDGALLIELGADEGGFIAGVARVLDRERAKHGVALDTPVTLILREGGRFSLADPSTGWSADLMGFGEDNARAFARLMRL